MSDEPSQYEKDTREQVRRLEDRIDGHLKDLGLELKDIKEKLMNRLPVWATLLISLLTTLTGILMGIVLSN